MKVVLFADLGRLGRKGDVAEVAAGYARNYLLPRKLALPATQGTLKQAEAMQRSRAGQDRRDKESFQAMAGRISSVPLRVAARAGAEGHLFGSVTTTEIAGHLSQAVGEEIDRRKVAVAHPIKTLGIHEFTVHLHPEVTASGSVEVVSDGVVEAEGDGGSASPKPPEAD